MKHILSVICCAMYLHNMSQAPLDVRITTQSSSGERVLIKALTGIVNREGKKKAPAKRENQFLWECP